MTSVVPCRRWCIHEVFLHEDTGLLQFVIGFYTAVFGLWILLPSPPFVVNNTVLSMSMFMPLEIWGLSMVSIGIILLVDVLTEGVVPFRVSWISNLIRFLIWTFIFLWGVFSNLTVPQIIIPGIIPVNALIAFSSGWLVLRGTWDRKRVLASTSLEGGL